MAHDATARETIKWKWASWDRNAFETQFLPELLEHLQAKRITEERYAQDLTEFMQVEVTRSKVNNWKSKKSYPLEKFALATIEMYQLHDKFDLPPPPRAQLDEEHIDSVLRIMETVKAIREEHIGQFLKPVQIARKIVNFANDDGVFPGGLKEMEILKYAYRAIPK